ncbi:putative alcohol dehydrogenase protein [Diplogelasinospora grovesii]|uniref:Alcohol dehydrogenase protein n=1 Tax=Diplogelasinospora grovesii TaxID=303347 RepID=A0AAN6N194_9PEZI|nr:putative alcohol dehydrogenase protein [Diplogelasinospora grovesii]
MEFGLPSTMKAQYLESFNTPYVFRRDVPLPILSSDHPHDVLVKVDAASYCHTDAVLSSGAMSPNPPVFPHVGSHEFAGTVVSLPEDPSHHGLKVGDRVGVPGRSFHPCGSCFECSSSPKPNSTSDQNPKKPSNEHNSNTDEQHPNHPDPYTDPPGYSVYCPYSSNLGISAPGGFQEYVVVDSRQVTPIPDGLSSVDTAVLMCAGLTIYAALKRCDLRQGQRVGIIGCGGGLGHLGLQFAYHMGLKVVGVDNAEKPLQLAQTIADSGRAETQIVDARAQQAADIRKHLGGEEDDDLKREMGDMGLDAVIILPESQRAFDYGVSLLRNHGLCVVVSFPEAGFHVSARDVVFRDISVVGSLVGSNRTLREMVGFAARHGVRASVKTFPLSKLNELVGVYHRGEGGKLVIDMTLPD